jgi:hypothetical protein
MPICKKCEERFPNKIKIDDKYRNCQRRKYCLTCSPFGQHNTRKLEEHSDTEKRCPKCETTKPIDQFYQRRGLKGGAPYCIPCTNKDVVDRQQKFKKKCVEYKGDVCSCCGYNEYIGALEFHHIDPSKKDFSPAHVRLTTFSKKIERELDKCILLCANCHREEHARLKGLL